MTTSPSSTSLSSLVVNAISGSLAGGVAVVFLQPLEVIKTRLESQTTSKLYTGIFNTLKQTPVKQLWRGSVPALLTAVPSATIFFSFVSFFSPSSSPSSSSSSSPSSPSSSAFYTLSVGATARTLATLTTAPAILLKTRYESVESVTIYGAKPRLLQVLSQVLSETSSSSSSCLRSFSRIQSLYQGLLPTLVRDVPWASIQFLGYTQLRHYLDTCNLPSSSPPHSLSASSSSTFFSSPFFSSSTLQLMIVGFSGALSGMFATLLTHPADVLKTRKQLLGLSSSSSSSTGLLELSRKMVQEEGVRVFFFGLKARLLHRALLPGITWTVFHKTQLLLTSSLQTKENF